MKLPSSVGQKKIKALEQMLLELGVGECGGWAPQDRPSHQKGPPPLPGEVVDEGRAVGGSSCCWLPTTVPPARPQS